MKQKTALEFEKQKTEAVSPWTLPLQYELGTESLEPLWITRVGFFSFYVVEGKQSLWVITRFPDGGRLGLRTMYCPDGNLELRNIDKTERSVKIDVHCILGDFQLLLEFPHQGELLFHCTTTLIPSAPLLMPYWPRDLVVLGNENDPLGAEGVIYTSQTRQRSGLLYLGLTHPLGGAALYFQNLTSLNEYCRQTENSLAEVVGGKWPELGLSLPPTTEKPLQAGKAITLSDVYMAFDGNTPKDNLVMSRQFVDLLAQIYLALPVVEAKYRHWPEIAEKSLRDLAGARKNWTKVEDHRYLRAYVGDEKTPPESMVQLTVLLPLLEYEAWSGQEIPINQEILKGLPQFFDQEVGVLGRWLVAAQDWLDGSEPQKNPRIMDSWYLYHSLLNLSRLALRGEESAKKLFLDSLDFAMRVAHKFEYKWPVFYNIDTLEIVKAETKEGEGGEKDVAGLYTHLMLQAWELTKETIYLEEAERAAQSLKDMAFDLFYQANEVLFAAGAMLRLWRETGNELYRDLSYLCLANIFNNVHLWECEYGYGQNFMSYFALFPLKDAPYTAVYEELEGFAAFHDYLFYMGDDCPAALKILTAEFIRLIQDRAYYYYPPALPAEMLVEKPRTGELDPELWIPLEDLQDGWEKAGEVGQEVYGAGIAFGLVTRQYWTIPNKKFLLYVSYPILEFSTAHAEAGEVTFRVLGDARLACRLRIIPVGKATLPHFEIQTEQGGDVEKLSGSPTSEGHIEYKLYGDCRVTIRWQPERQQRSNGKSNK